MPDVWAIWVLGLLLTVIFGLLGLIYKTFRSELNEIKTEVQRTDLAAFRAMDREREKHWMEWRERLEERFDKEIAELRRWRHEKGDPYIGACDRLKERLDRIERILNGKLTG